MTGDINIGVIGAGSRGGLAAHAHKPGQGSRLVAAADTSPVVLKSFRHRYGEDAFVTDDYRRLLDLKDIHAVFICTPDFCHEEQALAALQAGKAVYLEKPMAITIDGCDRILQAAYEHKVKLYVGHNMRHMGFVQKMKELIDTGAIGEVRAAWCRHFVSYGGDAYYKDWHADRTKTTGLLLQKGTHDIDVLHWLCGSYTRCVTAMGNLSVYNRIQDKHGADERGDAGWSDSHWPPLTLRGLNPVVDVEDLSMMLMELDSGVLASYQQCHYTPDAWRNYTIIGTEGRIENIGDDPPHCVIRVWNKRCGFKEHGDIEIPLPPADGGHGGGDPRIVAEFVRYVREDVPVTTSPLAARYSVAAGCQATWSLRNGSQPADIPPVEPEIAAYFSRR